MPDITQSRCVSQTIGIEGFGGRHSTTDVRQPTTDNRRSTAGSRQPTFDSRQPTADVRHGGLGARRLAGAQEAGCRMSKHSQLHFIRTVIPFSGLDGLADVCGGLGVCRRHENACSAGRTEKGCSCRLRRSTGWHGLFVAHVYPPWHCFRIRPHRTSVMSAPRQSRPLRAQCRCRPAM